MGALIGTAVVVVALCAWLLVWALCRASQRGDEEMAAMIERFYAVDGSYGGTDDDEDNAPQPG